MRIGSLFSGIGGLERGLHSAGDVVAWQCESDSYCRSVLAKHWPNTPMFTDIRALGKEALGNLQQIDLICGGFP